MPRGEYPEDVRFRAAMLLAAGRSFSQIEQELGVSASSLRRWRKDEDFASAVSEFRAETLETIMGAISGHLTTAVEALSRNLTCGSPHAEIRAAAELIGSFVRLREEGELSDRLSKLESLLREETQENVR